jgi:hypothetical protein
MPYMHDPVPRFLHAFAKMPPARKKTATRLKGDTAAVASQGDLRRLSALHDLGIITELEFKYLVEQCRHQHRH